MIRLIASDMDGTLLNNDHDIDIETVEAIRKAEEAGIIFAISTGREYDSVKVLLDKHNIKAQCVLSNGAEYRDEDGNILDVINIKEESAKKIIEILDKNKMSARIFTEKGVFTTSTREMPIFTFINKMDRESKDSFELLEEIENELGIKTYPMNWPIGSGKDFKGVYERDNNRIIAFSAGNHGQSAVDAVEGSVDDPKFREILGEALHDKLMEDIELLDIAGDELDLEKVKSGELTPVFFGSALTNFGVEPFLEHFLEMTTAPLPRNSSIGEIDPFDDNFSAFVFKIQANMNKAHRDRIAFMRICSGKFEKGEDVYHMQGGKKIKLAQPQQFMAQDREIVEEAYAGDIIGVFDPGIFSIGDTLCSPSNKFKFEGIPTFAPEHFARVRPVDTMKRKQFVKGVTQIAQEGAIQVFRELFIGMEEIIVGVVGVLQFEVLEYRLKNEYNVDIKMDRLPFRYVRWIENKDVDMEKLNLTSDTKKVKDFKDRNILIFQNDWGISWALDHNKGLVLSGVGKSDE